MNRLLCAAMQKSLGFHVHRPVQGAGSLIATVTEITHLVFEQPRSMFARRLSTMGPQKTSAEGRSVVPKRTKAVVPKITLIADKQMSVTSLEDAQKLANRRDLHLIKLKELDSKTQRPVYKLVTAAEMHAQELGELKTTEKATGVDKDKSQKKSDKSLTIGGRISEHDLASRLKNIAKWLAKRHEVRILIQGHAADMANSEQIVKVIEKSIQEPKVIGKIVQKRSKGTVIKFIVIPLAPAVNESSAPPA